MKQTIRQCAAVCLGLVWTGHGLAQTPLRVDSRDIFAPVAGQIGTSDILERDGRDGVARVGVLAYCADIAPNAAALGLMSYQRGARAHFPVNAPPGGAGGIVDGSFDRQGQFGAQNLVDMLMYDDGIPRFRDVVLVDGDRERPTAKELLENFDVVIAFTDRQCGIPIPAGIANQAATALARFARAGRGVVLTGFAFDQSIGFGNAIFRRGLSPFRKAGLGVDTRCSRPGLLVDASPGADPDTDTVTGPGPCPIGSCAGLTPPNGDTEAGCTAQFPGFPENPNPARAKECLDTAGNFCGDPIFQPHPVTADLACDHMLSLVNGPTISSWATALTEADVDPTATLCFNYDIDLGGEPLPFLAINADRNIVALNTYPPDAHDINKFWYQCQVGNAVQYAAGNRDKCRDRGCNDAGAPPLP